MTKKYSIPASSSRFAHLVEKPIAFFSSEYALEDDLPVYAGGLGVLAGDFLLEAGQAGLPVAAVGLLYHQGFETFTPLEVRRQGRLLVSQDTRLLTGLNLAADSGVAPDPGRLGFELLKEEGGEPMLLGIELDHNIIYIQVWRKIYGTVHFFLLDTAVEKNTPADQAIAAFLYPKDFKTKLMQEIVFGIGAVKLFRKLKIRPSIYHLNEGHTAFVALGLTVEYLHDHPEVTDFAAALEKIKPEIVATKHTILPGAGLFFSRTDFQGILDVYLERHKVSFDDFCGIGSWEKEPQIFSMTKFLLKSAARANAVSKSHATFERKAHPQSELFSISNGVNLDRWQAPEFRERALHQIPDEELWQVHSHYREALIRRINEKTGTPLNDSALTVVWARRFAAYKRPTLLFKNPERLLKLLADRTRPIQFIISGQPNISDEEGISLLKEIFQHTQNPSFAGKVVWLPNYSLALAKKLVLGADVWLNTPMRGLEASGTSGIKSAANGGLQFSTHDGWVDGIDWQGRGWILSEADIESRLYDMLEGEIAPLFYERDAQGLPLQWVQMMRSSMALIQKQYSTKRVLEDYLSKLYFPDS